MDDLQALSAALTPFLPYPQGVTTAVLQYGGIFTAYGSPCAALNMGIVRQLFWDLHLDYHMRRRGIEHND